MFLLTHCLDLAKHGCIGNTLSCMSEVQKCHKGFCCICSTPNPHRGQCNTQMNSVKKVLNEKAITRQQLCGHRWPVPH